MKSKREITTGLLTLAIACAFGQEPPPTEPPPQQQPEAATETPALPKVNLTVGWSSWNLSGNENKFRQYATAPEGLFLREITFGDRFGSRHDAFLSAKSPWQDDYRLAGTARLFNGGTYITAGATRNRFFDIDPSVLFGNERKIEQGQIRQQITRDVSVSLTSKMDQQDMNFPAPRDPQHQRTRIWNASAQGSLWKDGFVDLSFTDWRYWDRTNVQPDSNMQRWSAGLAHDFGENFSLHGAYSRSLIKQPAFDTTNEIESWSFGGNWFLNENTSIFGEFRNDRLDLPTVENAYVRERAFARGRVVHRFGRGWTGQFGYSRLALERINASQTFVDVPKWHNFDLQVSGRLSPSVRITAKGSRSTMEDGATMETEDVRALYWRNRMAAEIKLDAGSELVNGYLVIGLRENRNDERDVRVRNQNLTFGATFQAKPELELYIESSYDQWSGRTSDPLAPDLNLFFPDGTTFTLGGNWTINERAYASANYTLFNTHNDNPLGLPHGNVRGNFFTGSLHYRTPMGFELGLTLAPWQYKDRLYSGFGYSTGMIQLSARARF